VINVPVDCWQLIVTVHRFRWRIGGLEAKHNKSLSTKSMFEKKAGICAWILKISKSYFEKKVS